MSLPNGTVPMERTHCGACTNNGAISIDMLIGITCGGCGRHFHIGVERLVATAEPLFCPTCEGACLVTDIDIEGDQS